MIGLMIRIAGQLGRYARLMPAIAGMVLVLQVAAQADVLTINGGAKFTNYPMVTLGIDAALHGGTVQAMRFSIDDSTWTDWEPVAASKRFKLTEPLSLSFYDVFLQFQQDGVAVPDPPYTAAIVYDDLVDTGFFGGQGVALLGGAANDRGKGIAVQPDGKLLVVGTVEQAAGNTDIVLWRLTAQGEPDTGFGVQGSVVIDVGTADRAAGVALQGDGKILVLGTVGDAATAWEVRRYDSAGGLDPSFGSAGVYQEGGSGANEAGNLLVQPDGGIVVVGTRDVSGAKKIQVIRLTTAGALDSTFNGNTGYYRPSLPGNSFGNGVALQADGKILLVGTYANPTDTDVFVQRLKTDGTLDDFNGLNDFYMNEDLGNDEGLGIAVQPDGKIVVVGAYQWSEGDTDIWVIRLNGDGTRDNEFNASVGDYKDGDIFNDRAEAVVVQPDGKIVVVGTYGFDTDTDILAFRLNADGTTDNTVYNFYGFYNVNSGDDEGQGVALQSDGNIVVVGTFSQEAGDTDIHVHRMFGQKETLTVSTTGGGSVADDLGAFSWVDLSGEGDYIKGAPVTLTAVPATGYVFTAWGGDCAGTSPVCTVTMDGAKTVTASFSQEPPAAPTGLSGVPGNGTASISWTANQESGITGYKVYYGITSGNYATPDPVGTTPAYVISGLTNGATYYIAVSALKNGVEGPKSAEITVTPGINLSVTVVGTGGGTVSSTPGGISCLDGTGCSAVFDAAPVVLSATPSAGSIFAGWSGACSGTDDCTVTQYGPMAVTATFTKIPPVKLTAGTTSYYSTIAEAYAACIGVTSCTIEAQATELVGNVTLANAIAVLFKGGYDATFSSSPGLTTLQGVVTVGMGSLTAQNVVIR
ncbi:InlB B-repeat-containing protein [Geobacter sulfurreducens]|uniref:InlB B-repeat-containing protein n=1 Tax=Geobacter sulfurreducens TaxID=35554 RepID=UPI000DBB36CF|nr:fibronectin type III domain-containing protein [Geobacter sulfurreducens]BBA71143.1 hypothetical protein YM18_2627 [Geobacter sulfurreducens]